MRERILTAWILRSLLLLASAVAIVGAAILGPNNDGDTAFRLLLLGIALYVVSRILDKR